MSGRRIQRVYREGRRAQGRLVVLFSAPGTGTVATVAGRRVGGAVHRNRARRILRAAWRELDPRVGGARDVVLVATPRIRGAKTQDLVAEMERLTGDLAWTG